MRITLGKYTVINDADGFRAERYGEPWRNLTGDGLVIAMAQEIEELRSRLPSNPTQDIFALIGSDTSVEDLIKATGIHKKIVYNVVANLKRRGKIVRLSYGRYARNK